MSSTVICRLCLNTNRRSYFINHTVLQETWERLTDAQFDPNDGRPLLVCYMCCAHLRNSHELRKRALKAEELFSKYLTNNSFVDPKKLISLIVSNTHNNDYNYAIQEQHNLDCGQKVPERVEAIKKEIKDDEVMNIKEEGGKMFSYSVPVEEENLVVDTISIKKEIEDVKEEINSESEMHDTVTETQPVLCDNEDRLRKRSFEEMAKSDVSVVFEWIDTGVTAKKGNTEDLHLTAKHNVVNEAIMERKSLNNIFTCQPKELSVTFDENISLNVHDSASNDRLNSYSRDKVFSCKLCKYECFTKMSYYIHLRQHHTGGDKACVSDFCDYGATDNDNLNEQVMHEPKKEELFSYYKCPEHVSLRKKLDECLCENTEEKSHKCDFCVSKAIDTDNLKKDIIYQHTEEKNYTCHICQKNFPTKVQVNRHMHIHSGDKPYKCDLCEYRTSDNGNLKKHLLIKHKKEKSYKCHTCQENFVTKSNLNRHHLRVHTGEKAYKCDLCDYRTVDSGSLKNHLMFKHTKEKNYSCHTCQKNFVTKFSLQRHIRVHTGEKPYKCDLCDYRATNSGIIKRHLLIKHKEENFECDICQKKFTTKNQLNIHQHIHTGEKLYKCELCDYWTAHSGNLKTHLKYKHIREKKYECDICQKNFVREADLNRHQHVHTGEKRYKCHLCDYGVSASESLKKHIILKHTEEKSS